MENSTITFITDQLKALTSIPSPSGFTKEVAQYLVSTLEEMGFTPERSRKGNVCVTIGGEGSPLILAAHVDTLGAMVRSIKSNGRLRPTTLGGHQWCTADGENCTVHTRDGKVYTGVVLNKEPSAHVADQKVEATEENMEILLDENVSTEKDVKELGIQVGDIIAMDPRTVVTPSGYIKSRFLDDKLSAAILLAYGKYLVTELSELAKANGLDYAIDVYPHYGSDVEASLRGGFDIRHGLIGPGVYASHNYERSHIDGVKNTVALLKAYLSK